MYEATYGQKGGPLPDVKPARLKLPDGRVVVEVKRERVLDAMVRWWIWDDKDRVPGSVSLYAGGPGGPGYPATAWVLEEDAHAKFDVSDVPILTRDKQARKEMPIARGVVDYFPKALAAVAHVSYIANEQHNPGEPMHWARGKSVDHADCIVRHLVERGTVDDDGLRHSAKLAWRALALLQEELEAAEKAEAGDRG